MMDEARTLFLSTREDYIARERAASEKVDQVLLAGAAGALALSLTFIEKLAPAPHAVTMWMLEARRVLRYTSSLAQGRAG